MCLTGCASQSKISSMRPPEMLMRLNVVNTASLQIPHSYLFVSHVGPIPFALDDAVAGLQIGVAVPNVCDLCVLDSLEAPVGEPELAGELPLQLRRRGERGHSQ